MRFAAFFLVVLMTLLSSARAETAHDFAFTSIDGEALPLSEFKGQVVLVVNTASRCGFTPQYDGLQELYDTYRDDGFIVLGVPSNDFGAQEPGQAEEIKAFCAVNFSITFPMTDKTYVKGEAAHPFYQWAADELGLLAKPRWNFHKYLIGRDGRLLDWFSSPTSPSSSKLRRAVESALAG